MALTILQTFTKVFAPLWLVLAPAAVGGWVLLLPWTLPRKLLGIGQRTPSPLRVAKFSPVPGTPPARTLFFIHGWPDSGHMWEAQVAFFTHKGYTCVVVTLPNHDGVGGGGWGMDFDPLVAELLAAVKDAAAEAGGQVVLFCHDWGAVLGHLVAERAPELVSHIVALDVGRVMPDTAAFTFFLATYQFFNILMFLLGGPAGSWATRSFLAMGKYRARPMAEVHSDMNYLYFYFWRKRLFNWGKLALPSPYKCTAPYFFAYGSRKIAMFHGDRWLDTVRASPVNRVLACDSDHWITVKCSPTLNAAVHDWLTVPAPEG